MCLEDLRLGRGRYPQKAAVQVNQTIVQDLLPPDPRRVAIVFTFRGGIQVDPVTTDHTSDRVLLFAELTGSVLPVIVLDVYMPTFLARIEDFGQLVTGKWMQQAQLFSQALITVTAVPIITDVVAPIMDGQRKT